MPALDSERARDDLAAVTGGYSPVMIEHLFDEALVVGVAARAVALDQQDLQQAKLTEELGLRHPVTYTAEERLAIATHEAGHATLAYLCGRDDDHPSPLRRLECCRSSNAGARSACSVTPTTRSGSRRRSRSCCRSSRVAFGGMVAEELAFGESSTGPSADLEEATKMAATMVGSLGMGGSLLSLGTTDIVSKVLDDEPSRAAAEAILVAAKRDATELLQRYRPIHAALRDALLERDELVGDEILDVISDAILRHELATIDLRDALSDDAVTPDAAEPRSLL